MKEKIEVNVPNGVFYSLIVLVVISVFAVSVYAFGGNSPSTMGHTLNEVRPSCSGILRSSGTDNSWSCISVMPSCSGTNRGLQWTGSSWACATYSSSSPSPSCSWSGWEDVCGSDRQFDYPTEVCSERPRTIERCSGGEIVDSKQVVCCPLDAPV